MLDYGLILDAMLQVIDLGEDEIIFPAVYKSKRLEIDTVILTNDFLTDNKVREKKSKILYAKMLLNWFAGVMERINSVFLAIIKNFN